MCITTALGIEESAANPTPARRSSRWDFARFLRSLVIPAAIQEWLNTDLILSDQTEEAARAQAMNLCQTELQRMQFRLNMLYEDRLEGRISSSLYDRKATETSKRQTQIEEQIRKIEAAILPTATQCVGLMVPISGAANGFAETVSEDQRRLLRLVLKEASWKGGELRISLNEPFEKLRLSNRESTCSSNGLPPNQPNFDNWRRERDSNPR